MFIIEKKQKMFLDSRISKVMSKYKRNALRFIILFFFFSAFTENSVRKIFAYIILSRLLLISGGSSSSSLFININSTLNVVNE